MFSYWSKFHVNHVNIITGVIAIFVYKGLTKNPEIGKTLSELCPISEDWDKLGILNLARMFLTKRFCMLQNARVTAFTASELLRKNLQGGGGGGGGGKITSTPYPPRLGLNQGRSNLA